MLLENSENLYLKKCKAQGLATSTLINYHYCLQTFFNYCHSKGVQEAEQVDQFLLMDFLGHIKEKYSSTTTKDKFIVIKALFSYLSKIQAIPENPAQDLQKPKVNKKMVPAFSPEEVKEILQEYDKNTFLGFRNYVIMALLFGTGIRKSELLNICLHDIDFPEGLLKIHGKGNKERLVPLGSNLKRLLKNYTTKRDVYIKEHMFENNKGLFIARDGGALSVGAVNTIFRHLKDSKKTWSARVSPHTFRHTFAKFYLLNGGDVFSLQRILGHEDISTTRIYIDLNTDDIKQQAQKFSPFENKRWQF